MDAPPPEPKQPPAFLLGGYRILFPLAALSAITSLILWLFMLQGQMYPPSAFEPFAWHSHEMLFGFIAAAVGGFVLTAVPNWTNRPALQGTPLLGLGLLWVAGRFCAYATNLVGLLPAALIDCAFLAAIATYVARQVVLSGNKRNAPVALLISLLCLANVLSYVEVSTWNASRGLVEQGLGLRLGLGTVTLLLALIGGRVTPTFTLNWLKQQGAQKLPQQMNRLDVVGLASIALFVILWVIFDQGNATGLAALLAGSMTALRLSRWRGLKTTQEPLLFVLHLGYGWLAIALILMGISNLFPSFPTSTGLHALTTGAMTTMILGVMSRAILGHSGLPLKADRLILMMITCLQLSAVARVVAAAESRVDMLLHLAGILYCLTFLLFMIRFLPIVGRQSG